MFEVDDEGCPTEASLDAIRHADLNGCGGHWLVHEFPQLAARLPCAVVRVCDIVDGARGPAKEVFFATQGWSGAEALIAAVLANRLLKMRYYAKWERGGRHTFIVPLRQAAPTTPAALTATKDGSPP